LLPEVAETAVREIVEKHILARRLGLRLG
jgi:hypothetical protein